MRFLLSGYYGFGNLGDEALLRIIVTALRTRFPYAVIDVLSHRPDATRHEYGVEATPRADPQRVRAAIGAADVVLSGGGGLLQNATSLRSLLYYLGIIRAAIAAKKATFIFAQSIGPLDFVGRQLVRQACRGLSGATTRDEGSRALLAGLLPGVVVERTADPVFLFEPPDGASDLSLRGIASDRPLAVISVRKTAHFAAGVERLAAAADRLAELGAHVAFVPFGGPQDAEASTIVMRRCRSNPVLVPVDGLDDAAQIFARASVAIGVRLHAVVLAVCLGVPFVAVPYDPKVANLCDDLGYPLAPLWVPGRNDQARAGTGLIDELWRRRGELSERLRNDAVRMRTLAQRNFTMLERIVAASPAR